MGYGFMGAKLCLGYLGLIKPEVDLIHTILRTSSRLGGEWVLVDSGECDALLLYNAEKSLSPFIMKSNTQLILIKRRGEISSDYVFLKPFRADELVDTLILIKTNLGGSAASPVTESSSPQELYRLKKWPSTALLARHKNFTLLAVYLSRGTKTIENLVTLSGHSESFCQQFIQILVEHDLVISEIQKIKPVRSVEATVEKTENKKTFLSLLKSRLGLGKS